MAGATCLVLSATVTVAAILAVTVQGYSTGAPGKDCWTDRPLHSNYLPAHDIPPYEILLSKTDPKADPDTYSPGEMINVTINSRDGTPFKGYLMKVYSSNGVSRGIWGARKNQQHVLKRCGVTHNNNTLETQTTILWIAPKVPVMDNIQFKAIVVKDYTTFYNNILSRPLKPNYPTLSFDKIFQRLVALANMKFNISIPTVQLPDLKVTSFLNTVGPAATTSDASKAEVAVNEPAVVGSSSGISSNSGASVSALDAKMTQKA